MKLRYEAQKRMRFKKNSFTGFRALSIGWWHSEEHGWVFNPDMSIGGYCSHQYCRSVRAFRRKLKKCPKGVEFVLSSRFVGYNVYGKGSKKIKS